MRRSFAPWMLLAALFTALPARSSAQVVVPPDYAAAVLVTGIPGPQGLAFDSAGQLYVAGAGSDQVFRISADGVASVFAESCPTPLAFMAGYPTKMTFGLDGNLYVGAVGAYNNPCNPSGDVYDKLLRIAPTGAVEVAASGTGCCADPFDDISGIATAPDGRLFFTDTWVSHSLFAYSPADRTLAQVAVYPEPWRWPFGGGWPTSAVFDATGGLLVSFLGATVPGEVLRFGPDGAFTHYADLSAAALRFDAMGVLWAVTADGTQVVRQLPDGSWQTFASGLQGAADLAFDAAGNLFVSESGTGSVLRISLSTLTVRIDIRPLLPVNLIKLGAPGIVPVAIFGGPGVDVASLDLASLSLAGAPVLSLSSGKPIALRWDLDRDGFQDVVVSFPNQALQLGPKDTVAVLAGRTLSGRLVRGSDSVKIIP